MERRGTVTPISSMFPIEEAQKASRHVQDAIADRQQQLNQLKGYINDNTNLINLVQKLPDDTHHNIMVPFGKAAFFPGRLIHTNEFMVLLGEGYFAERTSKQTTEILKRRGKALDAEVESLKAIMKDLKAEASFFDATANESSEGLVEIREDYVDELSVMTENDKPDSFISHEADSKKVVVEDEEYTHIFSRMDELEKEEEEAERAKESHEDEQKDNEDENPLDQNSADKPTKILPAEALNAPTVSKDPTPSGSVTNKAAELPERKEKIQAPPTTGSTAFHGSIKPTKILPAEASNAPAVSKDPTPWGSAMNRAPELPERNEKIHAPTTSSTAFPGSIIEHFHSIGVNEREQSAVRSTKPVSRFKMQRK